MVTHAWLEVQVWAYANLGYDPGALIDAVAQASEQRMRQFSPQNISNILWAYAKLCKRSPSRFRRCVSVCLTQMCSCMRSAISPPPPPSHPPPGLCNHI